MCVEIRSRRGNIVLGALGVIYAASALVLLVTHVVQTLGAASMTDRAIQVLLIVVIAASVWFIEIASRGLRIRLRRASPAHRAGAEAGS